MLCFAEDVLQNRWKDMKVFTISTTITARSNNAISQMRLIIGFAIAIIIVIIVVSIVKATHH